jgi:hypothetical protein
MGQFPFLTAPVKLNGEVGVMLSKHHVSVHEGVDLGMESVWIFNRVHHLIPILVPPSIFTPSKPNHSH